jgi:hypothetical protein
MLLVELISWFLIRLALLPRMGFKSMDIEEFRKRAILVNLISFNMTVKDSSQKKTFYLMIKHLMKIKATFKCSS